MEERGAGGGGGETSFLDRLFILTMIWFLR